MLLGAGPFTSTISGNTRYINFHSAFCIRNLTQKSWYSPSRMAADVPDIGAIDSKYDLSRLLFFGMCGFRGYRSSNGSWSTGVKESVLMKVKICEIPSSTSSGQALSKIRERWGTRLSSLSRLRVGFLFARSVLRRYQRLIQICLALL